MTILLFVGPSASGDDRPLPPGVVRRPPARAGDIHAAIAERPSGIALVDGLFGTAPSVMHKEILEALDCGIPVIGAASLGAIRAAELAPLGMEGVGAIYEAYRSGRLVRDDAVLVAHAPAALDWAPLTVSLVDAEHQLARAALPPALRARLLQRARRTPYFQRTWSILLDGVSLPPGDFGLDRGLKRADYHRLLARLGKGLTVPAPTVPPRLVPSACYRAMVSGAG